MENKASNETFGESAKLTSKWISDISSSMMEIYKKQFERSFDFYNNMINTTFGTTTKRNWNLMAGFPSLFSGGDGESNFFSPMSWMKPLEKSNPFSSTFDIFNKQLNEYNTNMAKIFQTRMPFLQPELTAATEKYQRALEEQLETTRNIFTALTETYTKQLDFSVESTKKLTTELNKQLIAAMKVNEELWKDMTKTFEHMSKEEMEEKSERSKKSEKKELINS